MESYGQEVRKHDALALRDIPLEKKINKFLANKYGRDHNRGSQPRYRVVWSVDSLETRYGTFNEFSSGIFLRTFIGAKQMPKYPWLSGRNARYVLEKLQNHGIPYALRHELMSWDGYEILYVFQNNPRLPLPLDLEIADIACHFDVNGTIKGSSYWQEMEQKKRTAVMKEGGEAINEEMYPLALHQGHTVVNKYGEDKIHGSKILTP